MSISKEVLMSKLVAAGLGAAMIIGSASIGYAQGPSTVGRAEQLPTEAFSKALIERRIDVVKNTLGLTSDQTKYWPAVEEAIRTNATARHQRLARLAARLNEQRETNPIELVNGRADALAERAQNLKRLAGAWKPLYESLDSTQKDRVRFLGAYVLHEMGDAVQSRRMRMEDDESGED
jgi:zinc resistance-associated protein